LKVPERSQFAPVTRDDDGPVFDEPWHAQVLALAFDLAERKVFSPAQWSDTLGAKLREASAEGKPDNQQTYYEAALAALEQLVAGEGTITNEILSGRVDAWRRAYLNTPHGKPVELTAATAPDRPA